MTENVPADQIEEIVGARRHPTVHIARAVTAEQTVYILHSAVCRASGIDLRECEYSKALDHGIQLDEWEGRMDIAEVVGVNSKGQLALKYSTGEEYAELAAAKSNTVFDAERAARLATTWDTGVRFAKVLRL